MNASTHVFVVNERSFPIHLQYRFAGTTPGQNYRRGRPYWELQADVARVREGDRIIFYLEKVGFYGMFYALGHPFWDNGNPTYLESSLGIPLIYRTEFLPDDVRSDPVSELDALDRLPEKARDVLWGLIYRKLKGRRGCSPLIPREADRLINMILDGQTISSSNGGSIAFDAKSKKLTQSNDPYSLYTGQKLNLPNAAQYYSGRKLGAESALQAEIMRSLGFENDTVSKLIVSDGQDLSWFGNEIYCGAGMQKIDILLECKSSSETFYYLIELKMKHHDNAIYDQLIRYRAWASNFFSVAQDKLTSIILCASPADANWSNTDILRENELKYSNISDFLRDFPDRLGIIYYRRQESKLEYIRVL